METINMKDGDSELDSGLASYTVHVQTYSTFFEFFVEGIEMSDISVTIDGVLSKKGLKMDQIRHIFIKKRKK